jgi:predicted aldo/keto reductase-like oxidoreductase
MRANVEKTEQLLLAAIDGGVNYFDTAYVYGDSETTLGEILYRNRARDKIFLATKLPHQKCRCYEDFEQLFQEQLVRLKTDKIDYYLIHNLPKLSQWRNLCEMGIERWITEKKRAGQISQIGFSFHGVQNEFIALLDAYEWEFCQIQYNYMNEHYQAGRLGLQSANAKGLPVIIMEPLLGGKLAKDLPHKAEKLFRDADPNLSPAAWALRWLWDQPEVTVAISGMNSAEQLTDNLKTAEVANCAITPEMAKLFAPVAAAFREAYKIPCTGCNYCQPCPSGVNIPACFFGYNMSYATGFVSGLQLYITGTGANNPKKNFSGHNCVKCGACEKKCPQHIEIVKSLEIVTKRMEPFWFSFVMKLVARVMR